jgi:ribA/ribD-fused uncharacterized protein
MKYFDSELLGARIFPEENSILFYGGMFSQWADCTYSAKIGNNTELVNCAEQAMMLYKAHHFGDREAYDKIKQSANPHTQKQIGRRIKGFDKDSWEAVALNFVTYSNYKKFTQNKTWRELLLLTGNQMIIEASPTDAIWGIGYSVQDPRVFIEKDKWGRNWLGVAIMAAREKIAADLELSDALYVEWNSELYAGYSLQYGIYNGTGIVWTTFFTTTNVGHAFKYTDFLPLGAVTNECVFVRIKKE